MRTLDIGLDVDNVFYPFWQIMARWTEVQKRLRAGTLGGVPRSWSWYKDQWKMGSAEWLSLYEKGVHARVIFTEGAPLPGSLDAARNLHAAGHRLHFITHRTIPGVDAPLAFKRTAGWLLDWGIPITSLSVAEDKASVRTDVFLDDATHNYDALVAAGHPCPVIWSGPWNAGHPGRRVATWGQFLGLVTDLAADD